MTYEGTDRSRVLTPEGEAYRQIEGAGIVRGSDQVDLAHAFLDYILSAEVQELIPPTNWMFPVNREAAVPDKLGAVRRHPGAAPSSLDPERSPKTKPAGCDMWAAAIAR